MPSGISSRINLHGASFVPFCLGILGEELPELGADYSSLVFPAILDFRHFLPLLENARLGRPLISHSIRKLSLNFLKEEVHWKKLAYGMGGHWNTLATNTIRATNHM